MERDTDKGDAGQRRDEGGSGAAHRGAEGVSGRMQAGSRMQQGHSNTDRGSSGVVVDIVRVAVARIDHGSPPAAGARAGGPGD